MLYAKLIWSRRTPGCLGMHVVGKACVETNAFVGGAIDYAKYAWALPSFCIIQSEADPLQRRSSL